MVAAMAVDVLLRVMVAAMAVRVLLRVMVVAASVADAPSRVEVAMVADTQLPAAAEIMVAAGVRSQAVGAEEDIQLQATAAEDSKTMDPIAEGRV